MDFETLITFALSNNKKIVDILAKTEEGLPLIHPLRGPEGNVPSIVFSQIAGGDVVFADEAPYIERNTFEVTFYCENSEWSDIRDEIVKSLRDISFKIINEYSLTNPYTNIKHYTLHVRSMIEQEYFDFLMAEYKEKYLSLNDELEEIPEGDYFNGVIEDTEGLEFFE